MERKDYQDSEEGVLKKNSSAVKMSNTERKCGKQ